MLNLKSVAVSFLILLQSINIALAEGSPSSGQEIAIKWCSTCHLVTDGQTSASADVPTFKSIAEKYENEVDALVKFLIEPHPPMPDLSLTRREIQDLIAYLDSLE